MTINKCQGQTFIQVGIYVDQLIFTHGQLYVAYLRVPNFFAFYVIIRPIEKTQGKFTNSE